MAKANVLVSAAGWLLGFTEKLVAELKKQGVTDEAIHSFVMKKGDAAVEKIAAELAKMLKKGNNFPTWLTITTGAYFTYGEVRAALERQGNKISEWANDILTKTPLTQGKKQLELVKVTVKELTGKDQATREEIYRAAKEKGLELCPPEVGPYLRLQYQDQPFDEWLIIAMEPITDSAGGLLGVFGVGHGGDGRWLDGRGGGPGRVWDGAGRFVFRK